MRLVSRTPEAVIAAQEQAEPSFAASDTDAAEAAGEEDRTRFRDTRAGAIALGLIPFIAIGTAWATLSSSRPETWRFAVPKFRETMEALHYDLVVTTDGLTAVQATLKEALAGLLIAAIAGILIGTVIGLVRTAEIMLYPIITAIESIPKIAFAPLMLLIFGFGSAPKIALAATVAFFPILVSTQQGMRRIRLDEIDLMRSLQASGWQTFWKVRLPRAIPSIIAGIQVGLVFALVGAVVGEMVGGEGSGLGYLLILRSNQLDVPGMYSALILLGVVGIILTLAIRISDKLLANWQES